MGIGHATWHDGRTAEMNKRNGATQDSLISFQMKYRPEKYDGRPDADIAALLDVANSAQGMVLSKPLVGSQPYTAGW